jgi:hypothetical protein
MSNELKTKFRARLTAARDFKNGRGCEPYRHASTPSAYATWYRDEYNYLKVATRWVDIEKHIEGIISERRKLL